MANSLVPVTELGFAEFTGGLISQTLEAVITAYADQERTLAELRRVANLSTLQYIAEFGEELEIDNEIVKRFPPSKATGLESAVSPTAAYFPAYRNRVEKPAIKLLCGYAMTESDYAKATSGTGLQITKTGYENIRTTVATQLAEVRMRFLQTMASKGLPKVLVDSGRICSKLVFKMYESETATSSATKTKSSTINALIGQKVHKKFMVSPVHAKGPEFLSLKADIVGEVEVTFKTIIE